MKDSQSRVRYTGFLRYYDRHAANRISRANFPGEMQV